MQTAAQAFQIDQLLPTPKVYPPRGKRSTSKSAHHSFSMTNAADTISGLKLPSIYGPDKQEMNASPETEVTNKMQSQFNAACSEVAEGGQSGAESAGSSQRTLPLIIPREGGTGAGTSKSCGIWCSKGCPYHRRHEGGSGGVCRRQVKSLMNPTTGGGFAGGGAVGQSSMGPCSREWFKASNADNQDPESHARESHWNKHNPGSEDRGILAGEVAHLKQRLLRSELARSRLAVLLKQKDIQIQVCFSHSDQSLMTA